MEEEARASASGSWVSGKTGRKPGTHGRCCSWLGPAAASGAPATVTFRLQGGPGLARPFRRGAPSAVGRAGAQSLGQTLARDLLISGWLPSRAACAFPNWRHQIFAPRSRVGRKPWPRLRGGAPRARPPPPGGSAPADPTGRSARCRVPAGPGAPPRTCAGPRRGRKSRLACRGGSDCHRRLGQGCVRDARGLCPDSATKEALRGTFTGMRACRNGVPRGLQTADARNYSAANAERQHEALHFLKCFFF